MMGGGWVCIGEDEHFRRGVASVGFGIRKNPHRVGRGGFFGWVIPAGAGVCYFLRASSRALALAMTSSETFFGQGA